MINADSEMTILGYEKLRSRRALDVRVYVVENSIYPIKSQIKITYLKENYVALPHKPLDCLEY
jgi:hypothetical protein